MSAAQSDVITIDIHGHVVPASIVGHAGTYGPEIYRDDAGNAILKIGSYSIIGEGLIDGPFQVPELRLAEMDAVGVDILGVSITPLLLLYWLTPEEGAHWCRIVNDSMAEYCAADPDRLFFLPTLPLQDIEASIVELERATALGGRGIYIGSEACGKPLSDEYFWPLYAKAEATGTPILIHPYPVGQDGDPGAEKDGETHDWSKDALMAWMAGYLHQETLAVASLLLSGVFDEFPGLKFSVTHGGGAVPYQFGRFEQLTLKGSDNGTVSKPKAKQPLRNYLKNLTFDCVVHDPKARQYLVDFAGPEGVLIGSNFGGWDGVNGVDYIRELGLPADQERKILCDNAAELFGLQDKVANLQARVAVAERK
ncbi:MAG TPA: amidohydrolase family protein [Baekduia sp.]|nr:amidohydrolase family protein [Baekduia sp.]